MNKQRYYYIIINKKLKTFGKENYWQLEYNPLR